MLFVSGDMMVFTCKSRERKKKRVRRETTKADSEIPGDGLSSAQLSRTLRQGVKLSGDNMQKPPFADLADHTKVKT